jgi:hypothetical protein
MRVARQTYAERIPGITGGPTQWDREWRIVGRVP